MLPPLICNEAAMCIGRSLFFETYSYWCLLVVQQRICTGSVSSYNESLFISFCLLFVGVISCEALFHITRSLHYVGALCCKVFC